ncbi:MAG: hypothetical protein ACI8YQ_003042 [Polaribacter sp.]
MFYFIKQNSIAFDRFLKAVDRYRARNSALVAPENIKDLESADHIFFNVNRTHHEIVLSDILYIETLKDYVRIHIKTDKLVVKGSLGSAMKQLSEKDFVRVHRSYAVALNAGGVNLPIGISWWEEFSARMG